MTSAHSHISTCDNYKVCETKLSETKLSEQIDRVHKLRAEIQDLIGSAAGDDNIWVVLLEQAEHGML